MFEREKISKLAAMSVILLVFSNFALANRIIYVDDEVPSDFNNIQAAIDDANDGDTILVADGTYIGNGNRDIDFKGKAITVKSQNGAETCIIDCQASEEDLHRGFYLQSGEGNDSVLDGFTIMNGCAYNGAGIICNSSSPTIINCIIQNNVATVELGSDINWLTSGGGIYLSSSIYSSEDGNAKIINCCFLNNTASGEGGAIGSYGSHGTLFNCEMKYNRANRGGAIALNSDDMLIKNCVISGNYASVMVGGIYCRRSTPEINNCSIISNIGNNKGGGIHLSDSNVTVKNTIIYKNNALMGSEISLQYGSFEPSLLIISHSNVKGGITEIYIDNESTIDWQEGNIDTDPLFSDSGFWNPNGTPDDSNDDFWVDGDYHLKSQAGRFDPNTQSWVQDDVTSPCIDAGDPNSPIGLEPFPNGGYINMGTYGGTAEASKTYFGTPVCETIVAGDINGDCKVDMADMEILLLHWVEDLNQ